MFHALLRAAGFALMAGEWESAVKGILAGRPGEREELQDARRLFWEAGDPAGAAQQMPLRMGAERACLQVRNTHILVSFSVYSRASLPPRRLVPSRESRWVSVIWVLRPRPRSQCMQRR